MMGRLESGAAKLFYEFSLEEMFPANHVLRKIDRFLQFDDLRAHLKPLYSHTGRPSVDPELMCRMLIVGYCFGIRSERRLCDEVHLNLACRWFCKLGIEDGGWCHFGCRTVTLYTSRSGRKTVHTKASLVSKTTNGMRTIIALSVQLGSIWRQRANRLPMRNMSIVHETWNVQNVR